MKELVAEIEAFLEKHGRKIFDEDEGDMWTSPDALSLEMFKHQLADGKDINEIPYPNSSWESGGYKPYADKEAKKWHDDILHKIKKLRN